MSAIRTTYLGLIIPEQGQEGDLIKLTMGPIKKEKSLLTETLLCLLGTSVTSSQ